MHVVGANNQITKPLWGYKYADGNSSNYSSFTNSYLICGTNVSKQSATGLTAYEENDYKTASYDYTGYNMTLWDTTNGLPVFKSALSIWKNIIN